MVKAFRNRRKKQTLNSLNDLLLKEIDMREKFSTKSRTKRGTFSKKEVEDLSWKNYVRCFFDQLPGFESTWRCGKSNEKAESFLTHLWRLRHQAYMTVYTCHISYRHITYLHRIYNPTSSFIQFWVHAHVLTSACAPRCRMVKYSIVLIVPVYDLISFPSTKF